MNVIFSRWLAVFTLLGASGCQGSDPLLPAPVPEDAAERFAQAMCKLEFECRCGLHASIAECETKTVAAFDAIIDMGVSVDEACFDEYLDSPIFSECSEYFEESRWCVAMVGSGEIGDSCIRWNMFTMLDGQTCKAGLRCSVTGICEDPYNPAPLHTEPCNPEFSLACGGELHCDEESHTCVERLADGQVCSNIFECRIGSYCRPALGVDGICTPQIEIGQPCSPDEVRPCVNEGWCDAVSKICVDLKPLICANQPVDR